MRKNLSFKGSVSLFSCYQLKDVRVAKQNVFGKNKVAVMEVSCHQLDVY